MSKRAGPAEDAVYDLPVEARRLRQIVAEMSDGVIIATARGEIVWANACALALYGIAALEDLGGSAAGFRSLFDLRHRNQRRLEASHYPLDRLIAGDAFRDIVVDVARAGADPHCTQRLRGLLLVDDDGKLSHVALIINDETERVQAEERFERMFNANPAPAAILRLNDLRFVRINTGFAEMTGYHVEDVIGRSAYEIDVLEGAARRELAIERLKAGKTIPQMEALLQLPGGGEKCVLVAGQPIEVGDTDCMLFTFADLDGRRQAEASLRQSEARFETAFRLTPVPTLIASRDDMRILLVNDALLHGTGFSKHDVVGSSAAKLLWTPVDGAELERQLQADGHVQAHPMALRTEAGGTRPVSVSAEAVTIRDQSCVLLVAMDVAERERTRADIARAIGAAMQDTRWFTDAVLKRLDQAHPDSVGGPEKGGVATLPPRARQIVELVCEGISDEEIASRLKLSRSTVRNHLSSIYRRTGTKGRAKLVVWARERHLSDEP